MLQDRHAWIIYVCQLENIIQYRLLECWQSLVSVQHYYMCLCILHVYYVRMDQPLRDACRDDVNKVCSLNYKQSSMEYPPAHVIHCLYTSYLTPATKVCVCVCACTRACMYISC